MSTKIDREGAEHLRFTGRPVVNTPSAQALAAAEIIREVLAGYADVYQRSVAVDLTVNVANSLISALRAALARPQEEAEDDLRSLKEADAMLGDIGALLRNQTQFTGSYTEIVKQLLAASRAPVAVGVEPNDGFDHPAEFREGQWWVEELDKLTKNGTDDQKRAMAVVHHLLKHDHSGGYFIACPVCDASTGLRYAIGDDPRPLLIEQWNRRTTPSAGAGGSVGDRPCTCHPDDNPPNPCAKKYALSDCRAVQAQDAAPVGQKPLTVVYRKMPESCGRNNWVALLRGIDRSEYPYRVRYAADCVRHIIGELAEKPFILDYDSDERTPCHLCGGSGSLGDKPCPGLKFDGTAHDIAPVPTGVQGDAARLDWLELQDLNDLSFGYVIDAPQDGLKFVHPGDGKPHYAKTLRAAIDAAIASQSTKGA
jgi:hypothetical protein